MLSTISHIKSVNSVERKMSVLLELFHLRNVCMSIQHVPLTFYYKKATRIAHVTWASRKLRSQSKSTLGRCGEKPFFNKNNFFQKLNTFWNSFLTIFKVLQLGFTQSFQVQIGHRLHEHGNTATCQFGYLKQLIIYHIWSVKTPIRHGKLLASPVKGHKTAFSISIAVGCVIISWLSSDQIYNETIYVYIYDSNTLYI